MRPRALVAATVLLGAALVFGAPSARAACHAFTVSVNPVTVAETGKTTITVTRDGSVADSSVRVSTRNETAVAPGDYNTLDERVNFTGSEKSKTFDVAMVNDAADEPNETFKVRVSDGAGCAPNPSYSYSPDATVTITDDDPAPPPPPTPTPVPPTPSPTPSPTPTPTPTPSPTPTPTPTPTATLFALEEEDGGSGVAWLAAGLAAAAVVSAGGYWFWRRRNRPWLGA